MNRYFDTCERLLILKCSHEQILERLISDLIEFDALSDYRAREVAKVILRLCK